MCMCVGGCVGDVWVWGDVYVCVDGCVGVGVHMMGGKEAGEGKGEVPHDIQYTFKYVYMVYFDLIQMWKLQLM